MVIDFVTGEPFVLNGPTLERLFSCPTNPGFVNNGLLRTMALSLGVDNGPSVATSFKTRHGPGLAGKYACMPISPHDYNRAGKYARMHIGMQGN